MLIDVVSKILNEGLFCLLFFIWLFFFSIEIQIIFFVLYNFFIVVVLYKGLCLDVEIGKFIKLFLFCIIQLIFVKMVLKIFIFIFNIFKFVDQFLVCEVYYRLGEYFLCIFNDDLFFQLVLSCNLFVYFFFLEWIVENKNIFLVWLLEFFIMYIRKFVEEDKGDEGL